MQRNSRIAVACATAILSVGGLPAVLAIAAPIDQSASTQEFAHTAPEGAPRLIVRFKPSSGKDKRDELRRKVHGEKHRTLSVPGLEILELPKGADTAAAKRDIEQDPDVAYVEEPFAWQTFATPNDPQFVNQDGLHNTGQTGALADQDIDAPEAWDLTTGAASVTVAVIDSGVDYTHPDLAPNLYANPGESGVGRETNGIDDDGNGLVDDVRGWDFVENRNTPMPRSSLSGGSYHGTHVAGIVAARGNNGIGVAGVSWGSKIMPLQIQPIAAGPFNPLDPAAILSALDYAGDMGVKVVNGSFGGGGFSQASKDIIDAHPNTLYVFAAGNDFRNNDTTPTYPCSYTSSNILCVGNSDNTGALHERINDPVVGGSSYGLTAVDLAAPGTEIVSTLPNGRYGKLSGTSMASPMVAGAAALALSRTPALTTAQLKAALMDNVDLAPAWQSKSVTGGQLNVNRVLRGTMQVGAATISASGATVTYTAAPGASETRIVVRGSNIEFTDRSVALSAGAGCTRVNAKLVRCPTAGITSIVVNAGDGNDTVVNGTSISATLNGGDGDDKLSGGDGTDTLNGGNGNDTLWGGLAGDIMSGNAGTDTVTYAGRRPGEMINAGINGFTMSGGVADNNLDRVNTDVEVLVGHNGPDQLSGQVSATVNQSFMGLTGDDTFIGDPGDDDIDGGGGKDSLGNTVTTAGLTVNLGLTSRQATGALGNDVIKGIDRMNGTAFGDTITGGAADEIIHGGDGNDTLNGGGGRDIVSYKGAAGVTVNLTLGAQNTIGAGTDTLSGFEGIEGSPLADTLTGDGTDNVFRPLQGGDTIIGAAGTDTVDYSDVGRLDAHTVNVNLGAATPTGAVTVNGVVSTQTLNTIENAIGGAGNDTFTGSSGNNKFAGLGGNDTINGAGGTDTVDFSRKLGERPVAVNLGITASQSISPQEGSDTISNVEGVIGTAVDDQFIASAANNVFDGGGEHGGDTVAYTTATAGVTVNLALAGGQNTVGSGTDTFVSIENVFGSPFADTLTGTAGGNLLAGFAGVDSLNAGGGHDGIVSSGDATNDTINCGTEFDEAFMDRAPNDPTTTGCEVLKRQP